jgi:hypothetical protein
MLLEELFGLLDFDGSDVGCDGLLCPRDRTQHHHCRDCKASNEWLFHCFFPYQGMGYVCRQLRIQAVLSRFKTHEDHNRNWRFHQCIHRKALAEMREHPG